MDDGWMDDNIDIVVRKEAFLKKLKPRKFEMNIILTFFNLENTPLKFFKY